MIASLDNVSKSYGGQDVFLDVSARINDADRIGLIGVNGAGKTTLLNVLLGAEEADDGEIFLNKDARVGWLHQNSGLDVRSTVYEEMRSVFSDVLAVQNRMEELASEIEASPEDASLQKAYDAQLAMFTAKDGYSIDVRIKRVLNGMGFPAESWEKQVDTMSGGEKTRLALSRLLLEEPDLLVLDEPTNHLDMATLAWLEEYLTAYKGAVLVVSHDRFFLDRIVSSIWEIEDGSLETYKGNYTKYKTLRKERQETRLRQWEKQQNEISSLKDYISRNAVRASTAQLAASREKQLEKMEGLKKPRLKRPHPHFRFEAPKRAAQDVLQVHELDLMAGNTQRVLASDVSFEVHRGDRLAVIGANGTGKTTLLKALLGPETVPAVEWGANTSVGYYDQENRGLNGEASVVSELMNKVPGLLEGDARSLLARVLLTGEDVFKQVADLSGGERAKLGFAVLMAKDANVLLLDEPTNHLDLAAREALEEALREYEGTLVFVSHDRYFINALAGEILALEEGQARLAEGNYDSYLRVTAARNAERENAPGSAAAPAKGAAQKAQRRKEAERRQALYEIEKRIKELETEQASLHAQIEQNAQNYEVLQEACARLELVDRQHEAAMETWMELDEDDASVS